MHSIEPLFQMDSFANPFDVDQVISSAAEIAAGIDAVTHGPAGVADLKASLGWIARSARSLDLAAPQ